MSETIVVHTQRSDCEVWHLSPKEFKKFGKHMDEVLPGWRTIPPTALQDFYLYNEKARLWLYEFLYEPSDELCGEGNGLQIIIPNT